MKSKISLEAVLANWPKDLRVVQPVDTSVHLVRGGKALVHGCVYPTGKKIMIHVSPGTFQWNNGTDRMTPYLNFSKFTRETIAAAMIVMVLAQTEDRYGGMKHEEMLSAMRTDKNALERQLRLAKGVSSDDHPSIVSFVAAVEQMIYRVSGRQLEDERRALRTYVAKMVDQISEEELVTMWREAIAARVMTS